MCGIWAILGFNEDAVPDARALLDRLAARGPEYTALLKIPATQLTLGFTRLAINGLTSAGHQPFHTDHMYVVCNGEIYNYRELAQRWNLELPEGTSDCAVIPALARRLSPTELCRTLDGVFAFVLYDRTTDSVLVARDPYGVRPLFHGTLGSGAHAWASEIKGLPKCCEVVEPFPPGTWARYNATTGELLEMQKYHAIPTTKLAIFSAPVYRDEAKRALSTALVAAVKKRLLSDRPIGALVSGGVDSSLIAAIAARELARDGKRLHTFSIGMPGSTDLAYAEKVAKHINSIHHQIVVSPEDFIMAIRTVIIATETYDITSVRASVGNYLVGKYIKEHTDIKVVFNGDGSDEVGGGYLYFYAAPSDEEFEAESERLLSDIYMYDVLRSDRCMTAHGLEARTPFLDKGVVAAWRAIGTEFRRPRRADAAGRGSHMEKQILREAFENEGLLPLDVLWRKKEAFSDGVSATTDSWYLRCAAHAAESGITPEYIKTVTRGWHNPPSTPEGFWYRRIFEEEFGVAATACIPYMWMPRWVAGATDPSARTLAGIY
jgi:asparagine synthase (glutamine-hydrolysing)